MIEGREEKGQELDSSEPEFWNVRYATGKTPWDFRGVPAALSAFLKSSTPGSALIPGCGAAYEVRAFCESGWSVTAIDFSRVAVKLARSQLGALADCVVLGDFFTHNFGAVHFDLIYERTFLCAMPPELWPAYANRVGQLLRSGGKLAGVFLYGEQTEPPPYPLTQNKAGELFAERFSLVKSLRITDSLPVFEGNEHWQEWALNGPQPS